MKQQAADASYSTIRHAGGAGRRRLAAGLAGVLMACLLVTGAAWAEAAPVPPPPVPSAERVANPYGIEALWQQGDWVARGTLLVLLVMSAGSWYIGIVKLIEQAQLMRDARQTRGFWQAASVPEGMATLRQESPFRYIAEEGVHAVSHHEGTLVEQIELVTWIGMSIQHAHDVVNGRLQGGLTLLATVGSTAPFVGLFGTVWAIYHALTAIGIAGQASIDKVAGPVGEALIMTAFGLAVAVPAVLGYNWLVRRNKVAMERVRQFSNEVHMALLGKPDRRSAKAG
jgi:biopolymer transport protein ExbB